MTPPKLSRCGGGHAAPGWTATALQAERRMPYDAVVFLEDVEWLAGTGETWERAAARLHLTPDAMEKRLRRLSRLDLARRVPGYVQWTCDRQRQTRRTV